MTVKNLLGPVRLRLPGSLQRHRHPGDRTARDHVRPRQGLMKEGRGVRRQRRLRSFRASTAVGGVARTNAMETLDVINPGVQLEILFEV